MYDAQADSTGNTFALTADDQQFKGTIQAGAIRTVALGRICSAAGAGELKVTPAES